MKYCRALKASVKYYQLFSFHSSVYYFNSKLHLSLESLTCDHIISARKVEFQCLGEPWNYNVLGVLQVLSLVKVVPL